MGTRSIRSYHKIVSNLIIKWLTYLTPYFRASNFLCDFSRLSSIAKFAETGIHKHQYFDYQMTTHASRNATHGVPEEFTQFLKTTNTLIIG